MSILFIPDKSILTSRLQTLICPVNCEGLMGSGLALEFSKRYKGLLYHYRKACERGAINITDGFPSFWVHRTSGWKQQILCLPVERSYSDKPELETIFRGIDLLVQTYRQHDITSLAIPMLGTESGSYTWDDIGYDVVCRLSALDIPMALYGEEPFDKKKNIRR